MKLIKPLFIKHILKVTQMMSEIILSTSKAEGLAAFLILLTLVGAIIGFALYWLPTIIAYRKNLKNKSDIFLLNFLIGWSVIGWVYCVIKATEEKKDN